MDLNTTKWTLQEKLTQIAEWKFGSGTPACLLGDNQWGLPLGGIAQEAIDEIERLRIGTIYHTWQPLGTAPVPSATEINPRVYRFRCLLQDKKGYVFEGNAHYVQFSRARNPEWVLRWYDAANRLCSPMPIYWMPMPAPRSD